jgi:hypothetical protein
MSTNTDLGEYFCPILLRFGLPCIHHLRRAYLSGQAIPKSLLHPRWWIRGTITRYTNWEPRYPDDVARVTPQPEPSYTVDDLLGVLPPEEKARFEYQILQSKKALEETGKRYLAMSKLPIKRPDAQPRRQINQRKTHGKANTRGLTAAEIAERQLNARERAEKKAKKARDRAFGNPEGESQGGTTMTLAIRSPERPTLRAASPSLPASTAPPRLQLQREDSPEQEEQVQEQVQLQGRSKRRRIATASYKEAREQGLMGSLGHSQTQHHA